MLIEELSASINTLPDIGYKRIAELRQMGIDSIRSLLMHIPRDYIDLSKHLSLAEAHMGRFANTICVIKAKDYIGQGRKKILRIFVDDDTENAVLVCFGRNFLDKAFDIGDKVFVNGFFEYKYGRLQSTSFSIEKYTDKSDSYGKIIPVYSVKGKISQKLMRKLIKEAIKRYLPMLDEPLPDKLIADNNLMPIREAVQEIHFPTSIDNIKKAKRRFAYQELFALQLMLMRNSIKRKKSYQSYAVFDTELRDKIEKSIGFALTVDQKKVLEEIFKDTINPIPMARLLQGDVGSGKTLVALLASVPYIEAGFQVAMMVPTELLALQHAENAANLLGKYGIRIGLLTGSQKTASRKTLLAAISSCEVDLIIGTHSLFGNDVRYKNLRLIIIDEQHKFGVAQRAKLLEKASNPDILLMSATPIPRTMALTLYGDMDISTIKTMPPGRKPVITRLAVHGKEEKIYAWVENELKKGNKAYFVYPMIEDKDETELKSAEKMYEELKKRYKNYKVALLHSKTAEEQKKAIIQGFSHGDISVLVATSVIEVGVNVPNATCMVIEHAERFGLATLHQLRGRVGRSDKQAYTFLLYSSNLTEDAKARLMTLRNNTDGFLIAEEDLKIRGPGDILEGTVQAGKLRLLFSNPIEDKALLEKTHSDAARLLKADIALLRPEHTYLNRLINIVSGDIAI
ncbi:ATP-dependent DNA helicase RecG [Spirochaetia bacterium 38H-sp]|uniref:ATP-dependent DNA helicase RecG n=1 Tax=Rarispira pelagica TaxID=3141764 RepID=A0ABU9UD52_9SPIR